MKNLKILRFMKSLKLQMKEIILSKYANLTDQTFAVKEITAHIFMVIEFVINFEFQVFVQNINVLKDILKNVSILRKVNANGAPDANTSTKQTMIQMTKIQMKALRKVWNQPWLKIIMRIL